MKKAIEFVGWWLLFAIANLVGCARPVVYHRTIEHTIETHVVDADPSIALARALKATVTIEFENSCGSGVLVGPNAILTAAHVVEHEGKFVVEFFDGKTFTGAVAKLDHATDLALVFFDGHAETSPLTLSDHAPRLMSSVWNFGSAACIPGEASRALWSWLAGDGPNRLLVGGFMFPGMSGGPVIDDTGALVAINDAAYITDRARGTVAPQMGQVVDYAVVRAFLK